MGAITVNDINEESIVTMNEKWEKLKASNGDYLRDAGSVLFVNLFKKCPEAQVLFGFPLDIYPDPEKLLGSRRFMMHAIFLMEMIDSTLVMLGKDNEKLAETLRDLGKKHVTYGVKPEYFPFMQQSIILMMKDSLGDEFDTRDVEVWNEVFGALIEDIIEAQRQCALEEAAKNKAFVVKSWQKLKDVKNYEEKGGVVLFQHLFELLPEAKPLFGFPLSLDPKADYAVTSRRFMNHAVFLIEMIDKTVNMLGVDNDTLHENLMELGKKHVTFGVEPDYFPVMTQAIKLMLKDLLGSEEFKYEDEKAWDKVLTALIADMMKGQRSLDKGLAANNKSSVVTSWRLLAQQPNYEEHAGVILFKKLFKDSPESKVLFGFPLQMDVESVSDSRRFVTHAVFLVQMIEKALNQLGDDNETLTETMYALGAKHVRYGVKPEYFPYMTDAIVAMLRETLTVKFTDIDEKAWREVLNALIVDMTKAQRDTRMKQMIEDGEV